MLQAIRSRATSWVVKLLFGLLILSFGVWGIGDIFRQPGAEATVITVGAQKVTGVEVVEQVRRDVDQLRPMFGGTLDMAQARQLGIVDRSIEQIVQRRLYAEAASDLGILVGDDAVRRTLAANPQFRNAGQFDARTFQAALQQMRTTEGLYVASLRQDIARVALTDPVASGAGAPRRWPNCSTATATRSAAPTPWSCRGRSSRISAPRTTPSCSRPSTGSRTASPRPSCAGSPPSR